jgi:cell division protein ZapA
MQCNDGEEPHLEDLGDLLDSEIERIKDAVGQVGDVRLLLMAGLVVADKLADALKRIEDLEEQIRKPSRPRATARCARARNSRRRSWQRLDAAARRLEALAMESGKPSGGNRQSGGGVRKPGLRPSPIGHAHDHPRHAVA